MAESKSVSALWPVADHCGYGVDERRIAGRSGGCLELYRLVEEQWGECVHIH